MNDMLTWGLVLLAVSLVLLLAELLVVSGGAIAVAAIVTAAGGVYCLFRYDTTWGLMGTATVLLIGPLAMLFGLSMWRHTPMGRRLIGAPADEETQHRREDQQRARDARRALIGKLGAAVTDLRPVGVVDVEGQRYDAACETGFLPAGSVIRVTECDPTQLRVRGTA